MKEKQHSRSGDRHDKRKHKKSSGHSKDKHHHKHHQHHHRPDRHTAAVNPSFQDDQIEHIELDVAGGGLRQRRISDAPSYHTDSSPNSRQASRKSQSHDLLQDLPSRRLASFAESHTLGRDHRKKSRQSRKKKAHATIRLRQGESLNLDAIAQDLLQDEDFADGPEELRKEEIRDLPLRLDQKLAVRSRVATVRSRGKRPSWFKRVKYKIALSWKHTKERLAEVGYSIELWKSSMKKVEGNFGTGVTSYFLFIKMLFLLNIPLFLIMTCFILTPHLLYRYLVKPPPAYNSSYFCPQSILTGDCWLNQTELYYGAYSGETFSIVPYMWYNMKLAYIFSCVVYFIVAFIYVMSSLVISYKRNYIEASGASDFHYVIKVLSGWDFTITAVQSAQLKHKSIFKDLQEYLVVFRKDEETRTCFQSFGLLLLRLLTNLLVIGILAGSGYLVWYLSITQALKVDNQIVGPIVLPLTISAINFILPFAFSILATFERYRQPRYELYITMGRTMLLNGVTLGALLVFWFNTVSCDKVDPFDRVIHDYGVECRECWETFMGTQIYRLVVMDFIFIILMTLIAEIGRKVMSRFCCSSLGAPEFNIARNTLNLIYSQALCWLGSFYSPIMPLIMIVKLFIIFYLKRLSVMTSCVPSIKPWRAGRTHTIILLQLLAAFLLCLGAVVYSIYQIKPSDTCGPYQGNNNTWEVVLDLFEQWQGQTAILKQVLAFLTSQGFVGLIIALLFVAFHYSRVISNGHQQMVHLLRKQLSLESMDKKYLTSLLQQTKHSYPHYGARVSQAAASPMLSPSGPPSGATDYTSLKMPTSPGHPWRGWVPNYFESAASHSHVHPAVELLSYRSISARPGRAGYIPYKRGGKTFVKAVVEDHNGLSNSPRNSRTPLGISPKASPASPKRAPLSSNGAPPRSSSPVPSASGILKRDSPSRDVYNTGYMDRLWEHEKGAISGDPGYLMVNSAGNNSGPEAQNQGYRAHSPTVVPNLPYHPPYDKIHK